MRLSSANPIATVSPEVIVALPAVAIVRCSADSAEPPARSSSR